MQNIKKLIKEELSKLSESSMDPQVDLTIKSLNMTEGIDITVQDNLIIAKIRGQSGYDYAGEEVFEIYVYTFNIEDNVMTQGMLYSNDHGVPHEIYFNDKGYISQQPKTVMEFLKLVSDKSEELK